MAIYQHVDELIGHTPLLSLTGFCRQESLNATLLAKLEMMNPAGSAKDRIARRMIEDARKAGILTDTTVIIEPTSGNTGIGLASIAAAYGYRIILTMPETMSVERRMLLAAYGAEIHLTPGAEGMQGAVKEAKRLAEAFPSAWIPSQFDNPSNPLAHYDTTGPELFSDTNGNIDIFVATVGTGGTFSGTAKYLKEKNPHIITVGVEPAASPLISKGVSGNHKIQGIGANFIPANFHSDMCDRMLTVTNEEAFYAAKTVAKTDGVLVGISSGAAIAAATGLAKAPENQGKTIVLICPDTGERYLSSDLFL